MAKTVKKEVKEVKEVKKVEVAVKGFNPEIPENKQREYR